MRWIFYPFAVLAALLVLPAAAKAQALDGNGNPVTSGNLFASGDDADVYAISLSGNERILLSISEPGADLDLALYDAQGNFLDASLSLQRTESLTVTTPGDYFIEVFPASGLTNITGASNYVLSVGQNLASTEQCTEFDCRRWNTTLLLWKKQRIDSDVRLLL